MHCIVKYLENLLNRHINILVRACMFAYQTLAYFYNYSHSCATKKEKMKMSNCAKGGSQYNWWEKIGTQSKTFKCSPIQNLMFTDEMGSLYYCTSQRETERRRKKTWRKLIEILISAPQNWYQLVTCFIDPQKALNKWYMWGTVFCHYVNYFWLVQHISSHNLILSNIVLY